MAEFFLKKTLPLLFVCIFIVVITLKALKIKNTFQTAIIETIDFSEKYCPLTLKIENKEYLEFSQVVITKNFFHIRAPFIMFPFLEGNKLLLDVKKVDIISVDVKSYRETNRLIFNQKRVFIRFLYPDTNQIAELSVRTRNISKLINALGYLGKNKCKTIESGNKIIT